MRLCDKPALGELGSPSEYEHALAEFRERMKATRSGEAPAAEDDLALLVSTLHEAFELADKLTPILRALERWNTGDAGADEMSKAIALYQRESES